MKSNFAGQLAGMFIFQNMQKLILKISSSKNLAIGFLSFVVNSFHLWYVITSTQVNALNLNW